MPVPTAAARRNAGPSRRQELNPHEESTLVPPAMGGGGTGVKGVLAVAEAGGDPCGTIVSLAGMVAQPQGPRMSVHGA